MSELRKAAEALADAVLGTIYMENFPRLAKAYGECRAALAEPDTQALEAEPVGYALESNGKLWHGKLYLGEKPEKDPGYTASGNKLTYVPVYRKPMLTNAVRFEKEPSVAPAPAGTEETR